MLLSAPKLDSPIAQQVDREQQAAPASHPTWVSSAHRETEHKRHRRKFRRNSDGSWTEIRRNEKRKKKKHGMLVRLSALNETALRNIEIYKINLRCSSLMCLVLTPLQPKPAISAMAGCCPAMDLPKPSVGRTGMKTSRLFLLKQCQPGTQQKKFTPSTLAGHRFGKGTLSRLKRCCSWVRHLLSIPGLGDETLGEIAGETIDETILHWGFLYFSAFNKHFDKRFNRQCGRVKGFVASKDSLLRTSCQVSRFAHMT